MQLEHSDSKTKDWALVQNAAMAIDIYGVEVRLGTLVCQINVQHVY